MFFTSNAANFASPMVAIASKALVSRELQERNNFWKDAGRIGRGALKVGETVAPLALMVREVPDFEARELQERNNFWKDAGRIGRGALKVGETVAPLALMVREVPDFEVRELGERNVLHEVTLLSLRSRW